MVSLPCASTWPPPAALSCFPGLQNALCPVCPLVFFSNHEKLVADVITVFVVRIVVFIYEEPKIPIYTDFFSDIRILIPSTFSTHVIFYSSPDFHDSPLRSSCTLSRLSFASSSIGDAGRKRYLTHLMLT